MLAGKKIPICCEKELPEILPEGLYCCEDFAEEPARPGIYIGIKRCGEKGVLSLIPKAVTVGIGCRRGTDKEKINRCVYEACKEADIDKKAISRVASIDLKAGHFRVVQGIRDSVCGLSGRSFKRCGGKFYFFCICKRDNGSRQRVREKCTSCK